MWSKRYPVVNLGQRIPPAFEAAQDHFFQEFAGKWGIVGVGDSYPHGDLVLEVMTKEDPETTAARLPAQFMGFPVRVIYTGEIVLH